MDLEFADQFSVEYLADGSAMVSIKDGGRFLVRDEGMEPSRPLEEDVAVIYRPLKNIYLAATSAMDLFCGLDALDPITLSGTEAAGWYIEEAKEAMENGDMVYAGKYDSPDYELILSKGCDLAIETAGTQITTVQTIHMTKKGATIVLVGYSASGEMTLPISLALDKELTFKTVFRYRHIYPMAIEAVASGKVNLKGIVTNLFTLDEIQQAMDYSIHNKADIVKAVIKIAPEQNS